MKTLQSYIAKLIIYCLRWQVHNNIPKSVKKGVIIMAPHTSYWDFFYGILIFFSLKMPVKIALKKEVMFFPLNVILNWLGAIPIDRKNIKQKIDATTTMLHTLQHNTSCFITIMPEGTRQHIQKWKTGFYRIAIKANVPIILGMLDYKKKKCGLMDIFYPTGNIQEDLPKIQSYYQEAIDINLKK